MDNKNRQVILMKMLSDMINVFHELKEELKNWKLSRKNQRDSKQKGTRIQIKKSVGDLNRS